MGIDPLSTGVSLAPHFLRGLGRFRDQNEARRFFGELHGLVRGNQAIPYESREALADHLRGLMVDPDFQGALADYLDQLDPTASARLEAFIRRVVVEHVAPSDVDRTMRGVMRGVELAVSRAKANPRDAEVLQTERVLAAVRELSETKVVYELLNVEWAPNWPQKALRKLGEASPHELPRLRERVGDGESLAAIERLIRKPDAWLEHEASGHVWVALARFAEHHGEWLLSREAIQRALRDPPKNDLVNLLVHSAITASIAGDEGARRADLERAVAIDPLHPRIRLERISEISDASEQLAVLGELSFEESDLNALVETHRAAAYLYLGDIPNAREHVGRAKALSPEMLQVQMLEANMQIHDNRLRVSRGERIDARVVQDACEGALALRDQLLPQRRYEEAAGLLMLAADAASIAGEPERGAEILRVATEEERMRGDGDEALAEAAVRAREPRLALELLSHEKPNTPGRQRIRAYALIFDPTADIAAVTAELDRLLNEVEDTDPEQRLVALARLMASSARGAEWSAKAERVLAQTEPQATISLKARWMARHETLDEVEQMLAPYRHEAWAREALFSAAAHQGEVGRASRIATAYLQRYTPSHDLRLEFAGAFADDRLVKRARPELRHLVDDETAPTNVRRQAFWGLVYLADDIPEQFALIEEWRAAFPDDPEVEDALRRLDARIRSGA